MTTVEERRRTPRLSGEALPDGLMGRIRPGHQVKLIDLSSGGALIDSARRLLPGTHVDVHLELGDDRHACRARVTRCGVSHLDAQIVVYRAGLAFDRDVEWLRRGDR